MELRLNYFTRVFFNIKSRPESNPTSSVVTTEPYVDSIGLSSGSPIHQAATWNLAKENRHAVAFKACIDILETHLKKPLFMYLTCFLSTSNGFQHSWYPWVAQHSIPGMLPIHRVAWKVVRWVTRTRPWVNPALTVREGEMCFWTRYFCWCLLWTQSKYHNEIPLDIVVVLFGWSVPNYWSALTSLHLKSATLWYMPKGQPKQRAGHQVLAHNTELHTPQWK